MKRITTLTGPSCAGKSTQEARLAAGGALRAISTTTRPPRAGEVDGVHYYFVTMAKFELMVADNAFAETASFGGHLYGLTAAELDRLFAIGDHVVVVCEPQGARQIRMYCLAKGGIESRPVFVCNPQMVIFGRFLERFYQDYERAKSTGSDDDAKRVMDNYCHRAVTIGDIENCWIQDAYGRLHPDGQGGARDGFKYDRLIDEFNAENIDQIATELLG